MVSCGKASYEFAGRRCDMATNSTSESGEASEALCWSLVAYRSKGEMENKRHDSRDSQALMWFNSETPLNMTVEDERTHTELSQRRVAMPWYAV